MERVVHLITPRWRKPLVGKPGEHHRDIARRLGYGRNGIWPAKEAAIRIAYIACSIDAEGRVDIEGFNLKRDRRGIGRWVKAHAHLIQGGIDITFYGPSPAMYFDSPSAAVRQLLSA